MVEHGLDALEAKRVNKQVAYTDWAAPIFTPIKKDGEARICGDFKVTMLRLHLHLILI